MAKTIRLLVITDAHGRIVGSAPDGATDHKEMGVGLTALPGQQIHSVEVPSGVERLEIAEERHAVLSRLLVAQPPSSPHSSKIVVRREHKDQPER
jgi:hypothetical protein